MTRTALTLAERLDAAKALVAKLEAEIANEAMRSDLREGDVVRFLFGRASTKKEMTGVIAGMQEEPRQGLMLRIIVGEGFDAETYKVNVHTILENVSLAGRQPA